MRKLIFGLALLLFTSSAWARSGTVVNAAIYEGGDNQLNNSGFEFSSTALGWTTTKLSGTTAATTIDTSNQKKGSQSALLTLTSATGELSQDVTKVQPNGMAITAGCWVKTTATDVQVCARSGASDVTCNNVSSGGNWVYQSATITGPANGTSVGVSVKNTTSGTETVNVDECYVGSAQSAQNVTPISQAQFMGRVVITACSSNWRTASTSFVDYSTQSSCSYATSGSAQAPGTNLPAIKFASLPPGEYILRYEGRLGATVSTNALVASYQFWDGTNTANETSTIGQSQSGVTLVHSSGITQTITYTTAQTNVTLSIRGKSSDASSNNDIYGTTAQPGVISVYRFPTASEVAYRPDILPASWSGYHNSSCSFNVTSTTYADITNSNSSCNLVQQTNTNFGTVSCAGGTGASCLPGITFTPTKPGAYLVCATGSAYNSVNNNNFTVEMTDGTNILSEMDDRDTANNSKPVTLCGIYNAASTASATIKWKGAATSGGTGSIDASGVGSVKQTTMNWSITALNQSMPSPVLIGPTCEMFGDTPSATLASTNTAVIKSWTLQKNTGNCLTAATSSTAGDSFTVNTAGMYTIKVKGTNGSTSGNTYGIAINGSAVLTGNPRTSTWANGMRGACANPAANGSCEASWTGRLSVGDVIWFVANAGPTADAQSAFDITLISN